MSASTQSDPAYKQRLINAMLHESASREAARSTTMLSGFWSPKLVFAVAGLALLSALAVFMLLFHHDTSVASSMSPLKQAEEDRNAGPVARGQVLAGDTVAHVAPQALSEARDSRDHNVLAAAPVEFKLKRSRTFENIGPIGVRLLRVNLKRRTCDLSMRLNDHRVVQRRLQLNRPLDVKREPSAAPFRIVVSSIARDSIAGVLTDSSANPPAAN